MIFWTIFSLPIKTCSQSAENSGSVNAVNLKAANKSRKFAVVWSMRGTSSTDAV